MPTRTLNFHGIGTPGPGIELAERPYWISAEMFESVIPAMAEWQIARPLHITFDDGNRSDLEIAAPLLARHGLRAHVFVLTGRIGRPGYLDVVDIRTLADMGFVIGSHGVDHVNWTEQDDAALERELAGSKSELGAVLGRPVTEAAIPFGSYDKRVLAALRRAGYTAAWTSDGGEMDPAAFLRPRLSIRSGMSLEDVRAAMLDPIALPRRVRRKLAMARKRLL